MSKQYLRECNRCGTVRSGRIGYCRDCGCPEFTLLRTEIRLACAVCDREDFDGIEDLPEDWEGINHDPQINDLEPGHWWTFLGHCPECAAEEKDSEWKRTHKEAAAS